MAEVAAKLALPAPRAERISLLLARCAAVIVLAIGALALTAWRLGMPDALPGLAGMTPNACVGTMAAGFALFCFTFRPLRPLARIIGLALILLGLLVLCEDLLGFDLGLDHALFPSLTPEADAPHARMAPGITGSLILFGLALLYAKRSRPSSAFSQVVTIIVLAQVLIVLAGFAYGVATYYYPFPFTSMSIYGATSAFLLALGLLAASPEYGVGAAIVEQSPAGEMLRRLLPGILVLPLVIGWFAHQAEVHTYYDSAATLAIFAVASILVLAVFAWTTIGAVRRADRDRNAALMELRGQREWLSTTLGSIGDGVIATDPSGSVLLLNRVAEQMTGWTVAEARGRPIWEVFRVIDANTRKPVDDPALKALRERAVTRLESGALLITRDEREIPVEHSGSPILGFDGSLAGAVLIFRDVTERRRTAQRQTMLVGELNHRVKNALAIVQSLVQASLRQATSRPAQAMAQTLAERLQALHRAHDLLLESQWSGASLKAMVERELDPYRREGGPKIAIKGPDVLLPPASTSILAMTLHELATNAVKYGALSHNNGQLGITWKLGRGNRLLLTWEERGSLHPAPTKRGSGFGMQLIDKGIRHNLGGETKLEFRPAGLYVEMNVPLEPSKEPRAKPQPAQATA
ncbi:sensor histidine kinase [Methyloceanibacter sp.]|uniref:sensor histidine kinase n=1 Tax=Methyloceanibacter sp. TaxID=1965321 RepID=UPI002D43794D|nr:HWE histidine kinase domain-containing protein [Methyloceanibacter sp.]HZP10710.1 HWE histidine kinase domain-containing protein [Methyloceanibacter sp.]